MAEGLARELFGPDIRVYSAGSSPSRVNPLAAQAMDECGISLSGHASSSVLEVDPSQVDLVITLCEEEVCPPALGNHPRLHWPIPDPDRSEEELTDQERLESFRVARESIRGMLKELAASRR